MYVYGSLPFTLGASVEVYCDCKNIFKGWFFQDVQMREVFHTYLEIMFIDGTYKLLELGIPLNLSCVKIPMDKVKLLVWLC